MELQSENIKWPLQWKQHKPNAAIFNNNIKYMKA